MKKKRNKNLCNNPAVQPGEKQKHLSLNQRISIQVGISNNISLVQIAHIVGKDNTTVSKEIRKHRKQTYVCSHTDCMWYRNCPVRNANPDHCTPKCMSCKAFYCKRRDRTPGACNNCPKIMHCRHNKYVYDAVIAHNEYLESITDSKKGCRATLEDLESDAEILSPLLARGVSLSVAVARCGKTLHYSARNYYRLIHKDTFYGLAPNIDLLSLRRTVGRRPRKTYACNPEKRIDPQYIAGREYSDLAAYILKNPKVSVVEMDTVYNNPEGPYLQTFLIRQYDLLIAFYTVSKSAAAMIAGVDMLEELLGKTLFEKYVQVILIDRGSEFSGVERLEHDSNGVQRTHVFFCDPRRPDQKARIEEKHALMRYMIPKKRSFASLGLDSQEKLNRVTSNVDSYPSSILEEESPLEIVKLADPELYNALTNFGVRFVSLNELILNESVLKDKN